MQTLARHRLVTSVAGPTGGYRLARTASEISVADVVEAVDGPMAIAQCWDDTGLSGCAQASQCHLRGPLAQIQDEISRMMRAMTLEDVCRSTPAPAAPRRVFDKAAVLPVVGAESSVR